MKRPIPNTITAWETSAHQRPTVVSVDTGICVHNYRSIRGFVEESVKVLAVVKADAYGHGAVPIAHALEKEGVDGFGVATLEEGLELRRCGVTAPIILLGGIFPWQAQAAVCTNLSAVIYNREGAEALNAAAALVGTTARVHLKIDTGMGRLGVLQEDLGEYLDFLEGLPYLEVEGLMTHFSTSDAPESPLFRQQLQLFTEITAFLKPRFSNLKWIHAANSAAILRDRKSHFTAVRPGLLLYGMTPRQTMRPALTLQPILEWKTRILSLQSHAEGVTLSYGETFTTTRETRVATLPVGYNDGYNRLLSNQGEVLIRGHRAPVLGRVCMDMTLVDVTDVPGVALYDEVVLLGGQGREIISAWQLAEQVGTIPYEIVCRIGRRVHRQYVLEPAQPAAPAALAKSV